jgi:hypothetical protein
MTISLILALTNVVLAIFCCVLAFWLMRLANLAIKLNALLLHLCVTSFTNHHAPIWGPWCAAHRLRVDVDFVPMPPPRRSRENWGR